MGKEELLRLMADEAVTIIDSRPEVEYGEGHIPAARSVPFENLKRRLAELQEDGGVILEQDGSNPV